MSSKGAVSTQQQPVKLTSPPSAPAPAPTPSAKTPPATAHVNSTAEHEGDDDHDDVIMRGEEDTSRQVPTTKISNNNSSSTTTTTTTSTSCAQEHHVVNNLQSDRSSANGSSGLDEPDSTQNATCADCRQLRREVHEVKEQLQFLIHQFNTFSNQWRPENGGTKQRSSSPPLSTLSTSSSSAHDSLISVLEQNNNQGDNNDGKTDSKTDAQSSSRGDDRNDERRNNICQPQVIRPQATLNGAIVKPMADVKNEHLAVTPPQLSDTNSVEIKQESPNSAVKRLLSPVADMHHVHAKQQRLVQSISPGPLPRGLDILSHASLLRASQSSSLSNDHISRLLAAHAQMQRPSAAVSLARTLVQTSQLPSINTSSLTSNHLHHHPLLSPTAIPGHNAAAALDAAVAAGHFGSLNGTGGINGTGSQNHNGTNGFNSSHSIASVSGTNAHVSAGSAPPATTSTSTSSAHGSQWNNLLMNYNTLLGYQAAQSAISHATLPLITDQQLEHILSQPQHHHSSSHSLANRSLSGGGLLNNDMLQSTSAQQLQNAIMAANSRQAALAAAASHSQPTMAAKLMAQRASENSDLPPESMFKLHASTLLESRDLSEHRKRAAPDDFVREFVEAETAINSEPKTDDIVIPVAEASQCDPTFRAVSEEQVLHSVKWHELELQEAVTRLAKKLAEKRVFGPMLMAKATVAGTNHSNYPNLPITGIIYIESICRRTLCPQMSRRQFAMYFRPAMKGLAARCRRIRHSLKPTDNNSSSMTPTTATPTLSMVQMVQGAAALASAAAAAAVNSKNAAANNALLQERSRLYTE